MTSSTEDDALPTLMQQGWNHLQLQRPLAAWASWQEELRQVPDSPAAMRALSTLASTTDLPASARAVARFQSPRGADQRARWDRIFQSRDLSDLVEAASAFATLAVEDPDDAAAAYNEGLCLAWLGRNFEAIGAVDRAVRLLAADDFDRAVEAWTMAEVLRHGAGAEALADDLRYAWIIDEPDPETIARLSGRVALIAPPTPDGPELEELRAETEIFEWLDRPLPGADDALDADVRMPRLLATVVRTPRALRLSSPEASSLEETRAPLERALGGEEHTIRREASALPLSLLDAAAFTSRFPRGLDLETVRRLSREAVEAYYEDRWIHVPRRGLGGLSPLEAARSAEGDAIVRARLVAVVRFREQLGARPLTEELYQGYPFDRLRRRLGLELWDAANVDAEDIRCMSPSELDALDPTTLDDVRLSEAFESALGLREDGRTVRFVAELTLRGSAVHPRLDLIELFGPLVRESMSAGRPEQALAWLDRARPMAGTGPSRRTFDVWSAEVHARSGDPVAARAIYETLIETSPDDAALALDAAETLLDNGYEEHARPFVRTALAVSRRVGDLPTGRRARFLEDEGWA